ncbi:MAG: mechanosensitive ion channel family protein [Planctomycetota bacterium]|nr:mechanosensitive ion channel family protein [Planctomycetota bacterium]
MPPPRFLALAALCACALAASARAGEDAPPPPRLLAQAQEQAVVAALQGEWIAEVGKENVLLVFREDRGFSLEEARGTYAFKGDKLELTSGSNAVAYAYELAGNQLTLSGADLPKPLKFTYRPALARLWGGLFEVTWESASRKFMRCVAVVGIAFAAWLLIVLLRFVSMLLVFGEWGPLRFIFRYHKNRTITIHRLVLNVAKYVVCFVALGYVLSELGINYTAYLASLSVIGLAIGFGSQGLVQDMVTGFFIIFEGQFDVGDMVEISGQTGVVRDLGLRMTKLANYQGQTVVIPNRNIAVVGNYTRGGLESFVDVAVADAQAAARAGPLVAALAAELTRQFDGIVLEPPEALGEVALATGERFVRVQLTIWPQQQWFIDQQFVPRLREAFKREDLEIPGDRVVAFYRRPDTNDVRPSARGFTSILGRALSDKHEH